MVSKIISGKSLIGALKYNENKVAQDKAELIWENKFQKDVHLLNFDDKLSRLKKLASKNTITKTNTIHISLNFAVDEELEKDKMTQIAIDYMEGIGFGDQPYLVYKHNDAGHPHIHIVSTNIKTTGERIPLHNLGRTKSEEARKIIEQQYGLVPASRVEIQKAEQTQLRKVVYGKDDTKRAISNVVRGVISSYKFTSLPELNAALSYYNVTADRGSKESRMYAKNGLLYWALDSGGKKTGIPIKASNIYGSPTLKTLEVKFNINQTLRTPFKETLKKNIDRLLSVKASESGFKQALQQKGIEVIYRKNDQGRLYGVTFVDHKSKVVFNGSDLGKAYSAAGLSNWFTSPELNKPANTIKFRHPDDSIKASQWSNTTFNQNPDQPSLIDDLLKSEYQEDNMPDSQLRRRKKKRKVTH
ncbi:MAG: relaxase/mobilization nuclease domain-containing protein [Daejeonella sp.]|uniref:relaxase/mobilization nuclease domain-containing protein n=1 Tax=Daejeonella sp. TaxID=2805397 RepID=UPI003C747740